MDYKKIETPWSSVGYLTYKRTYSRKINEDETEEWGDTVERVIKATDSQLHCNFTDEEKNVSLAI